jgi:hypothetical protein
MSWSNRMFRRLVPRVRIWGGYLSRPADPSLTVQRSRNELVKSRPERLSSLQYIPIEDTKQLDRLFNTFRDHMLEETFESPHVRKPTIWRESGRVAADRSYFFLKAFNKDGLLFEQSPEGWIVSRAEKIVHRETFVRSSSHWDQVRVFLSDQGNVRISSERFQLQHVSMLIYNQKLKESLTHEWTL